MKVASMGETDRGGAGLSALKLHGEFCNQGIDSTYYVNRKSTDINSVVAIPNRGGKEMSPFRVGQYSVRSTDVAFTTGHSCKDEKFLDHIWNKNDVILLRWSSVAVSDFCVSRWSHSKKPLVWCLSDMAPLTGGCHYSMGCDKYQLSCNPCPRITEGNFQYPEIVLRRRTKLWKNIVYVSPSRWLAKIAKESAIGKDKDIRVIQTGVELDVFKPFDQDAERRQLGIDNSKPVILFGAASVKDSRKGFKYLPELVDIINQKYGMKDMYTILIIGSSSPDLSELDCDVRVTGHISCREEIARAYSAADVTLLPYVEDNLPNVCLESIACGVPVVAFSVGGMPDIVIPNVNGDLARPFDVWDLAYRLVSTLNTGYQSKAIRQWAEMNIDIAEQARQYKDLFEECLEEE